MAVAIALPAGIAVLVGLELIAIAGLGGTGLGIGDLWGSVGWLALCCLSSGIAAWIIASLSKHWSLNRAVRIVLLAMLTKLLGVLLMPVILAIWSAPAALSGGEMPCFHIDNSCQTGLSGPDVVGGLVNAALSWYPVGVFMLIPGVLDMILLIPAAIWDKRMLARASHAAYRLS